MKRWPSTFFKKLKTYLYNSYFLPFKVLIRNKPKVFVIGFNKTGTTSLKFALKDLQYIVGDQRKSEALMPGIMAGSSKELINYCKQAEAFQDIPFSLPKVYKILDKHFPNSKFILTKRDSAEQWFNSLLNFHSKIYGNGRQPSEIDLKSGEKFLKEGFALRAIKWIYGEQLYNEESYKKKYLDHIEDVRSYFQKRPKDLLEINIADKDSYTRMCDFLGLSSDKKGFDWKNKTSERVIK